MTEDFAVFKNAQLAHMQTMFQDESHLFLVDLDKDRLWNTYLDSFPPGTNNIFRERREFDCSCCRQFVKQFGNVVAIKDNEVVTVWDFPAVGRYAPVVRALSDMVKAGAVSDVFVTDTKAYGTDKSRELMGDNVHVWDHFHAELPLRLVTTDKSRSIPRIMGDYRDSRNVFKRSLEEITPEALETVLDLVAEGNLYRGEEWIPALNEFMGLQDQYNALDIAHRDNWCWKTSVNLGGSVARIRNHSIGTLLNNLSEGMDAEHALRAYESVMAPTNYKRPKAVYTKAMVKRAEEAVTELGFIDSLPRRHAVLGDISVANTIWSNKDAAKSMAGLGVFDAMVADIDANPRQYQNATGIGIDSFISDVLPNAKEISVLLENRHSPNLVSLVAPVNAGALSMFKWSNNFSWAYSGNITDSSTRALVEKAGGRVDGDFRFSHSWNHPGQRNASLMDLHVFMPGNNTETISPSPHDRYGNDQRVGWNHRKHTRSGGVQDVDYVQPAPDGYIPVENTTFPSRKRMPDGRYLCKIHNWQWRPPTTGGFVAEIEFDGQVFEYVYEKPLANKEWITVAEVTLRNGVFSITHHLPEKSQSRVLWGLNTNKWHRVSIVMNSPNYWDGQVGIGNKHYFFMVPDCINNEQPNGFFNEYLRNDLVEHKRVFEALGSRMKAETTSDQLSGLGFSSTKRNYIVAKVDGRVMKVIF